MSVQCPFAPSTVPLVAPSAPVVTRFIECHLTEARISGLIALYQFADRGPVAIVFHDAPDAIRSQRFVGGVASALVSTVDRDDLTVLERALATVRFDDAAYSQVDITRDALGRPDARLGAPLSLEGAAERLGVTARELVTTEDLIGTMYHGWTPSFSAPDHLDLDTSRFGLGGVFTDSALPSVVGRPVPHQAPQTGTFH